jgi:hypothetical protein
MKQEVDEQERSVTRFAQLGLLLLIFYVVTDAVSKCNYEYVEFMSPKYEEYYMTKKHNFYEMVYLYVAIEVLCYFSGVLLILLGYYTYGSRMLLCALIPVSVVTHNIYRDNSFNFIGFMHISRNLGIAGGILLIQPLYCYISENKKLKLKIEKFEKLLSENEMNDLVQNMDERSKGEDTNVDNDVVKFNLRRRIRNGDF